MLFVHGDDGLVKRPFRRKDEEEARARHGWFGEWLLRQFSAGSPTSGLAYSEVERLCANAGSLVVAAAYAAPGKFRGRVERRPELGREAAVLSRRTADGFKASLEDRNHAVIAWPWDHMATSIAWQAARTNDTSEEVLGRALLDLGSTYAARHREQVTAVLDLWKQVAQGIHHSSEPPDLAVMGVQMLDAFEAVTAAAEAARTSG